MQKGMFHMKQSDIVNELYNASRNVRLLLEGSAASDLSKTLKHAAKVIQFYRNEIENRIGADETISEPE